ncbi:hypothetical protein BDU57DRAFT_597612 [Ampelomyces quisqualis]|uniref:Ubiquitin 3 binding protein But2 C-terminal domain-containing protein n=1 Tax=Ampelomyces quisqualis TaxID=50730 RepID=A0A6A5QCZ8_AMPQU|nr:hypothetical protein BDU57DRAFT_597612 [Ampelomyces quisqualis]
MHFSTLTTTISLLSLSLAAPAPLTPRFPPISNILQPTFLSRYSGTTGAISFNVATGSATKTNTGDITTLVTFENTSLDLPSTCRLRFFLDGTDASVVLEGTKQVNIFSSLNPAPAGGSPGWGGPGNQRNIDLGRFSLYKGGNGDLVPGLPTGVNGVACPKKNAGPVGFEVVPVGDVDRVEWSKGLSGLYLTWDV